MVLNNYVLPEQQTISENNNKGYRRLENWELLGILMCEQPEIIPSS